MHFFTRISYTMKNIIKQVNIMNRTKNGLIRYIILAAMGVLLHFAYDWSGQNKIIGLFSATNESTWEHLKLLFFPMLFATIWDSLRGNTGPGFLKRRILSIMGGMLVIVVLFFTVFGITGRVIEWFNVATFFIGLLTTLVLDNILAPEDNIYSAYTAWATFILFIVAFGVFTFKSPTVGIFYPFPQGTESFPIVSGK